MTPQQKYQQDLQRPGFVADPAQAIAVARLERLYQDLCQTPTPTRSRGLLGWLQKPKPRTPILGLYMWGGVGRGKTWLMDTFSTACRESASCAFTSTVSCTGCTMSSRG